MDFLYFSKNIKQITQFLKMNQDIHLTDLLGWPTQIIAELASGKSPMLDQLCELHKVLGISLNTLVSKEWTPDKYPLKLNFEQQKNQLIHSEQEFIEIPLYQRKARATNFAIARLQTVEERHLAKLCLPKAFFNNRNMQDLKAFEIDGNSMYPNFENGDVVIGEKLEIPMAFEEGKPHILLLKDSSLFFKRLFKVNQSPKKIQLCSDNLLFTALTLGVNLVAECWQVCYHLKKGEL